jgi:hypothetical protein
MKNQKTTMIRTNGSREPICSDVTDAPFSAAGHDDAPIGSGVDAGV